ncbi:hypothetical protein ZOSMA_189G00400 [Zostera marina]|uniref:Protein COFACTOR ASSEMBLY OF COMPLEX C SUBUNIT B CCB3, chloroplastic n=1 Tax=Zostera marina TaxID=29655 RepID=A0A0K9PQ42_ZOSMR|nr:hypothetical protein ZOSMA_189G00400 [Zostera marina]
MAAIQCSSSSFSHLMILQTSRGNFNLPLKFHVPVPSSAGKLPSRRCWKKRSSKIPRAILPGNGIEQGSLVLADLDPVTAKLIIGITGPILSVFGYLFIARIIMSWYPKLPVDKFPYVIAYAPTEPILDATRKLIPPVGGVDVTPVVWFALLSFFSEILLGPQGLLILLSQQVQQ